MRFIIFTIYFLASNMLFAQVDDSVSQKQMHEDLHVLVNSFADVHPTLYQYISKSDLQKIELEIKAELIESKTVMEFYPYIAKYIKEIRCGHTVPMPSIEYYTFQREDLKLIPLDVYLLNNKLYVKHNHQENIDIPIGSEILEIDERPIQKILEEMQSIISRDGFSSNFLDHKIEAEFSSIYLILYGRKESHKIILKNNELSSFLILEAGVPEVIKRSNKKDSTLYTEKMMGPGVNFYLYGPHEIPIIDLHAFQKGDFKKFYKKVFEEIEKSEAKDLVIDLRGNGGGYFMHEAELLKYLAAENFTFDFYRKRKISKKNKNIEVNLSTRLLVKTVFGLLPDSDKSDPKRNFQIRFKIKNKNHFAGRILVLTDGASFSASSNLASKLKHCSNSTFLGSETGGNEAGCGGTMFGLLTLPNSKIRIHFPYFYLDNKLTSEKIGSGVIPDIQITYSIEDRLNEVDKEMKKLEELILAD